MLSISKYSTIEYDIFAIGDAMDYRKQLRDLREDHDLTQLQVAKLINKSQQGYNHIELGRADLSIEDLAVLCKFYGVSADYIIGLSDDIGKKE